MHKDMLCASEEDAKAILLFKIRSRVNAAIMKAQADIILGRLRHLTGRRAGRLRDTEWARSRFFTQGDCASATMQYAALAQTHSPHV